MNPDTTGDKIGFMILAAPVAFLPFAFVGALAGTYVKGPEGTLGDGIEAMGDVASWAIYLTFYGLSYLFIKEG